MSAVVLAASAASSTIQGNDAADAAQPPKAATAESSAGGNTPPKARFPTDAVGSNLATGRFLGAAGAPGPLAAGVPSTVLDAYRRAHERTNLVQPNCRIPLELLAAIGKVESGHARGGRVDADGRTLTLILGPVLNGGAFAAIPDTDEGRLDGDTTWDRAVGPMQFIPGTWARWASDGNNDGTLDPHNVYDASLAAARYLCAANRDLGTPQGLDEAVLSYNHSTSYLSLVRSWMTVYRDGPIGIDDLTGLDYDPDYDYDPADDADYDPGPDPDVQALAPPQAPPITQPPTAAPHQEPPLTVPPRDPADPPLLPGQQQPPEQQPPAAEEESEPEPQSPPTPAPDPAACDLVDGLQDTVGGLVDGLVGGLLGSAQSPEDELCVQALELSDPPAVPTPPAPLTELVAIPPAEALAP